jgi:plastocyanin
MTKRSLKLVPRSTAWLACCIVLSILVFALSACGGPAATVNVKETKGSGPGDTGDVYMCDPATLSVHKGDTVSFTNLSDQTQDFDQGDAQKAGVDFVMAINQSTTATFNTTGTFTIKSEKGATITVTVQ